MLEQSMVLISNETISFEQHLRFREKSTLVISKSSWIPGENVNRYVLLWNRIVVTRHTDRQLLFYD